MSCPNRPPARLHPTSNGSKLVALLVESHPVAAVMCVYDARATPKPNGVPARVLQLTLRNPAANSLALLLNDDSATRPRAPRCVRYLNDAIYLYSGTSRTMIVAQACPDPVVVQVGHRYRTLSTAAGDGIAGAALPSGQTTGLAQTPDYIGRSLGAAERSGRRAGVDARPVAELEDPSLPFASVAWQNPLAGVEQVKPRGVSLIVAVQRSPPCIVSQLAGHYLNGGRATGNHFGNIVLLNTSGRPCSLAGRLTLTGLASNGQPDTVSVSEFITPPLVLSAHESVTSSWNQLRHTLTAIIGFAGEYRDDPTVPDGLCHMRTYPAAWSLTIGTQTLHVRNGGVGSYGHFYTCRNRLSAALSQSPHLFT